MCFADVRAFRVSNCRRRITPHHRIPGWRAGPGGGVEVPAGRVGGGTGAAERGGAGAGLSGGVVVSAGSEVRNDKLVYCLERGGRRIDSHSRPVY